MTFFEFELLLAALALAAGGILKGAVGAGAPIFAIPVLSLIFDVRYAVALLVVPNLVMNFSQWWQYRDRALSPAFMIMFSGGGALGALVGSFMLAYVPADMLLIGVGIVVLMYIAFRLLRPDWALAWPYALYLSGPAGFAGGVLQGAAGLSAPVSLTFMNALKLERPVFIASMSVFFMLMSVVQFPALAGLGLLTGTIMLQSLIALVLMLAFMPVGNYLARHVARETFDKLILVLLAVIAAKILVTPFF